VRSHFDELEQGGNAQRIVMAVDVVPGPFAPEIAARLLHLIVEELRTIGADIVAVNLEIRGDMASW
jgi:hypothetical protein